MSAKYGTDGKRSYDPDMQCAMLAEIRDPANEQVLQAMRVTAMSTSRLTAGFLCMAGQSREALPIANALLSGRDFEICTILPSSYGIVPETAAKVRDGFVTCATFWEIHSRSRSRNEVAIGYYLAGELTLCPADRNVQLVFDEPRGDRIVAICEADGRERVDTSPTRSVGAPSFQGDAGVRTPASATSLPRVKRDFEAILAQHHGTPSRYSSVPLDGVGDAARASEDGGFASPSPSPGWSPETFPRPMA